jgi:hypothetical protein
LALLYYARILDRDFTPLAKVVLVEALFRPAFRHAAAGAENVCDTRLLIEDLDAVLRMRLLVNGCCAEPAGSVAESRVGLLKSRLDGSDDGERLEPLEAAVAICLNKCEK